MDTASETKSPVRGGQTVSEKVARKDVEKWLDFKKVSEQKREENEATINALVTSVMSGALVVAEDGSHIVQKLQHPIGNEGQIKTLNYTARLTVGQRNKWLKGVKATDTADYLVAHIAALTGENKRVDEDMDTEDHSVAQNIALFFI